MPVSLSQVAVHLRPADNVAVAARHLQDGLEITANGHTLRLSGRVGLGHKFALRDIRKGEPINNGEYMSRSTMLAIMGRIAAYTGKTIKWTDAMKLDVDLTPKEFKDGYTFRDLPTPRIAVPGKTKPKDTLW